MDFENGGRIARTTLAEAKATGIINGTGIGEIDILDLSDRMDQLQAQINALLGSSEDSNQWLENFDTNRSAVDSTIADHKLIGAAIIATAVQREYLQRGTPSS